MIATNPILDVLSAPLCTDWTIERLAEQLLLKIIARQPENLRQVDEFVVDAETINDRQSQRLLRPLLACLAGKSAAEAGTSPDLYTGHLAFKRQGSEGPVWIEGEFENTQGRVCVRLRRRNHPPKTDQAITTPLPVVPHADPSSDPLISE